MLGGEEKYEDGAVGQKKLKTQDIPKESNVDERTQRTEGNNTHLPSPNLLQSLDEEERKDDTSVSTYAKDKQEAEQYQAAKQVFLTSEFFRSWIKSPKELENEIK
jgi:hypothetical protein